MTIFENLNNTEKTKLLNELNAVNYIYKKDVNILKEINYQKSIIIILSGSIKIIKNDFLGNQIIINTYYEDDIFLPFTYNLYTDEYETITGEDTKLLIFNMEYILKFEYRTNYFNQFVKNLISISFDLLQKHNERIEILSNKTVRNKLLSYFKITSKKNNSKTFLLPFTFTILAEYLGVDRSAMNRELKNLKDENLIEIKKKTIKLKYDF